MNDKELELLKKAMMNEDDGADYYFKQSQQWHEKTVCDNFIKLSEEEKLHSKWLRELFDSKKSFGDERVFSYLEVSRPKIYDWTDIKKISDLGIKDVFKKAMAMEEASYEYYKDIKASSQDKDLIQLLDILIEWELEHYKSFKEVYESM
ncbi:hypothetical protein EZV73_21390 [Acidaminobacter sp. JC074]|uniref:ferritin family protein n=1 Tax=Acidaminobacter sp. JC074 TaxID=2530199 RepID=UPI001F0EA57B|nr:ferritin family protein [Acidaminobacter sp. JC074]MCH4890149.1 hypothetical protein [Acidaminobacter sp. JC074]